MKLVKENEDDPNDYTVDDFNIFQGHLVAMPYSVSPRFRLDNNYTHYLEVGFDRSQNLEYYLTYYMRSNVWSTEKPSATCMQRMTDESIYSHPYIFEHALVNLFRTAKVYATPTSKTYADAAYSIYLASMCARLNPMLPIRLDNKEATLTFFNVGNADRSEWWYVSELDHVRQQGRGKVPSTALLNAVRDSDSVNYKYNTEALDILITDMYNSIDEEHLEHGYTPCIEFQRYLDGWIVRTYFVRDIDRELFGDRQWTCAFMEVDERLDIAAAKMIVSRQLESQRFEEARQWRKRSSTMLGG